MTTVFAGSPHTVLRPHVLAGLNALSNSSAAQPSVGALALSRVCARQPSRRRLQLPPDSPPPLPPTFKIGSSPPLPPPPLRSLSPSPPDLQLPPELPPEASASLPLGRPPGLAPGRPPGAGRVKSALFESYLQHEGLWQAAA